MTATQRKAPNRTATRKPIDPLLASIIRVRHAHMDLTTNPIEDGIRSLVRLREQTDFAIAHAVEQARFDGRSWADIAEALGVSTQAAHKRYAGITDR